MSNIGDFISRERYEEMLRNALYRISEEYIEKDELLKVFHEEIGLTDEEIEYFGYDFSELETQKGISLIHLHEQNDDCYLYLKKPYDMFRAAIAYQYNIKNDLDYLTLDSFASKFEDARIIDNMAFSFMCRHISPNGELASIFEFDFENDTLSVLNKNSNQWNRFHFCDIGEAIDAATFDDRLSLEDQHSIFIQHLIGNEIEESNETDEEESPSMSM